MVQRIPNPGEASSELAEATSNCCSSSNHMRVTAVESQEVIEVVNQLSTLMPRLRQALTRPGASEVG
jgi:plasmid replication initiation protein